MLNKPNGKFRIKKSTIDRAITCRIATGSFATNDLAYAGVNDPRVEPDVWLAHVLVDHHIVDDLTSLLEETINRTGPYKSAELEEYYKRTIVYIDTLIERVRADQCQLLQKTKPVAEEVNHLFCFSNLIRAIDFKKLHGEFATPDLAFAGFNANDTKVSIIDWIRAVFRKYGSQLDESKIAKIAYGITPTDSQTQQKTEQSYVEFLDLLLEAGIIFDTNSKESRNPAPEFSSTPYGSTLSMPAPLHPEFQMSGASAHGPVPR